MRWSWLTGILLLTAGAGRTAAGETGSIAGTLEKPEQVTALAAVDRQTGKNYPGRWDAHSGRFTISGLPLEARYDCRVDYGKARLEGVDFKVEPAEAEEDQTLSKTDREAIKALARSLNQFENEVNVLAVRGHARRAAVLLNKLRTQVFVNSRPGEVVWRLELWHFQRPEETWIKDPDELFLVLYRERIPRSIYDQKALTLDSALGGLRVTAEKPTFDVGTIRLPPPGPGIRLREDTPAGKKDG
jgi:hypothetical protein